MQDELPADRVQLVIVTPEDYVLGMSDLTGELMRYATNGRSACVTPGDILYLHLADWTSAQYW